MKRNISIFCDFDATISVIDVGDNLFRTYGNWNELYGGFADGRYDVLELNKLLCNSLRNDLTFDEISAFAITHDLDPYFTKFIDFCNIINNNDINNNINFTIISDGYDAYIKPILQHYKLDFLPVYCNSLIKKHNNTFEAKFFGAVEGCLCPTASCKRNVLINNSSDEDIVIYIGDGHTDYCGAEHSDIVFAKSRLAAYCNEKRIPHYPYKTFFDIYRILESKLKNNDLRHRHQAKMKRKTAFEVE